MLTITYVRVSTEDQVDYSPDAQAARCRQHAAQHDLGGVTVIRDEGFSGKNLDRPGMGQLLELVESGRVAHVVVWRLDRLSRDTVDLSTLMRLFERTCVSLHSVNEGRVDLTTAAGRMQVGIHGVFAQFYREHIVENVKLGQQQAVEKGRWQNRPPTGYSMVDGFLVPNEDAPVVVRIFQLRAEGLSYSAIEAKVGMKYSTVRQVVHNRAYLGLIKFSGQWYPGQHQPLVTEELFKRRSPRTRSWAPAWAQRAVGACPLRPLASVS
jgi:site-specific DNA recombinase